LSNTQEWCAKGITPQINNLQKIPKEKVLFWFKKIIHHQEIYIASVNGMGEEWGEALKETLEAQNIQSLLVESIFYKDTTFGFIGFDSVNNKRSWQKEERRLLRLAGNIIGEAYHGMAAEKKIRKAFAGTIEIIMSLLEVRDAYPAGHQRRVAQLTDKIADKFSLSNQDKKGLKVASKIHNIGKIVLPAEILSKPTKLTDLEFDHIKQHPVVGYKLLKNISFPWPVAEIILQHHERLDGSSYPQGLKDDKISLEAKILAVADGVEAMSSQRPYRPALGMNDALNEIKKYKGKYYEPDVVAACVAIIESGFKFMEVDGTVLST